MPKKILIVDDNPDVIKFCKAVLEANGYVALTAVDGNEGLDISEKERPDLIILDVLMPFQSGIKMYRKLRNNKLLKHIPVIILSGVSKRTFLRSQETLAGFEGQPVPEPQAYIEKPVEPEKLVEIVRKFVT